MTPMDIVANAIYHHMDAVISDLEAGYAAKFATEALVDGRIVDHAVQALIADGCNLPDDDMLKLAQTVLRSVAGEA